MNRWSIGWSNKWSINRVFFFKSHAKIDSFNILKKHNPELEKLGVEGGVHTFTLMY